MMAAVATSARVAKTSAEDVIAARVVEKFFQIAASTGADERVRYCVSDQTAPQGAEAQLRGRISAAPVVL